ncbi:MAG: DUF4145 domain-containing protein [Saprospiraceae bacterium]
MATADSLESLLEQAEYLLEQNYKDAACVIIGGVLESTLKSMLANKYPSVAFIPNKGLAHFNEKLHKECNAYDKVTFKLVDSYREVRNFAAHGNYDKYDKAGTKEFLGFTRRFISNWFSVPLSA